MPLARATSIAWLNRRRYTRRPRKKADNAVVPKIDNTQNANRGIHGFLRDFLAIDTRNRKRKFHLDIGSLCESLPSDVSVHHFTHGTGMNRCRHTSSTIKPLCEYRANTLRPLKAHTFFCCRGEARQTGRTIELRPGRLLRLDGVAVLKPPSTLVFEWSADQSLYLW